MSGKEASAKLAYILIAAAAILVVSFAVYYLSSANAGKRYLSINESTIAVFSDSEKNSYYTRFFELYGDETEMEYASPKYYDHYSKQRKIILLGIKDSRTERIIKEILGSDFDDRKTFSIVQDNVSFQGQQILIYYAPSADKLLGLINASKSSELNKPADASAAVSIFKSAPDYPQITGNVVDCTDGVTIFYFENPIMNGAMDADKYVRIQMYNPFAARSMSDLIPTGPQGIKDTAEEFLNETAGQELIVINAQCSSGKRYRIGMSINDFANIDIEKWKKNLQQAICPPGNSMTISTNSINTAELAGEYAAGKIGPDAVLDWGVGKMDDFYDSLPKTHSFVQTCPDYTQKTIITFALPAYYDEFEEKLDYSIDWSAMKINVDESKVASYSDPVVQHRIITSPSPNMVEYTISPEYNVYFLMDVSSEPAGIISKKWFLLGNTIINANQTVDYKGRVYFFDHWEINGCPFMKGDPELFLGGYYSKAIAYYVDLGQSANQPAGQQGSEKQEESVKKDPDLEISCDEIISKKEGSRYNITFNISNIGNDKTESGFWINVSNAWGWLEKILYNHTINSNKNAEISLEYDESQFFVNNEENLIMIEADSLNNISESREDNNICNKKILKEHAPYADLSIEEFDVYPSELKKGEDAMITVVVKNRGDVASNGFTISTNLAEDELDSKDVSLLAPGQTIDIKLEGTVHECGKQWLEIEIGDVSPGDSNMMNNGNMTKLDIACEEKTCGAIIDKYECSAGTCTADDFCIWNPSEGECTCSTSEVNCLSACGSDLGLCNQECVYPTYRQMSGDKWCQNDRMSEDYVCCCTPR